jgi:cobalt/nickel transport system permease protein
VSHLHIPDGLLPTPVWVLGFLITALLLSLFIWRASITGKLSLLPRAGVVGAFLLLAFSVPLGLPIHVNLAALAGILLGLDLGFLTVFVVNLLLALTGHGGLTVLGLNTVIVGSEAIVGSSVFRGLRNIMPAATWRSATAAGLAILVSSALMLGTLGLSSTGALDFAVYHEDHEHNHENNLVTGQARPALQELQEGDDETEHARRSLSSPSHPADLGRFAALILPLVLLSMFAEAAVTAGIVGYLAAARPGLLDQDQ